MGITYYCPQNLFSLKISLPSCIQQFERRLTTQACGLNPGRGALSPDSSTGPDPQSHRAAVQDEMIQFSSVAQSCPTLFDPMTRSTPGLPVHHQLPEFTWKSSVQFSSVAQSCPTLFDPMTRSTPGLPVHHQLPEFTWKS